jgi:methylenetetrahydrofolate dehydrogenase (NADP+)/methenyltetrahydrofolate cyclohydrolase
MGARVIDGRGLAPELKEELAAEVAGLRDAGVVSGLATVLVGSPAEAAVYERRVRSLAGELGYRYACERLPLDAEEAEVIATVGKLKEDPRVSGILVLKPLPDHVSEAAVYRALDPLKDIEAVTDVWLLKNTADATRISTRAEAARRSLETATTDGIVETDTVFARPARGKGSSDD